MATASDNFNRIEAPLSTGWAAQNGIAGQLKADGSNALGSNGGGADNASVRTDGFNADQYSEVVCAGALDDGGPLVRANTGAAQAYLLDIGATTYAIYKFNGSFNIMGATVAGTLTTLHTYRITATGASPVALEGFDNGSSVITRTDASSPYATGQPGAHCFNSGGVTWNSWNGGDLAAPSSAQDGIVMARSTRGLTTAPRVGGGGWA